ncbi:MAG: hypothetical protein JXQ90_07690 [Cyclobacteriaceae bacterium]
MDENDLIVRSYELIKQDFNLEEDFDYTEDQSFDRLHAWLARIVNYLLEKDFARLMNALYRIDVPETKVKHILTLSDPDNLASALTTAIIEREKQKVVLRKKYSKG